jgi:hypothetical protein
LVVVLLWLGSVVGWVATTKLPTTTFHFFSHLNILLPQ